MKNIKGKAYLIGAGPGDPELISVKGAECIEKADVVIYDYLASPHLLKYAKADAEIIYAGKKGGHHTLSQDKISELIVNKTKSGKVIARLKGGDPFIFGRGGEEAEALAEAGLEFEIVPGITSAIAVPAYAGIPLSHRKLTSTIAFVTGHEDPTKNDSRIDWEALAKGIGTIVFLMGVKNLSNIVSRLIKHGKPADTPVALIHRGTTPRQYTVAGTLEDIVGRAKKSGITSPSIIIVGEVIKLKDKLKWFENRPLLGKRIVVTRAREQASDLVKKLTNFGADCIECPTIKVVPPKDFSQLDNAIKHLSDYDWLVFTSVNGVKYFFDRLFDNGLDLRAVNNIRTAVIGPATQKKLFEYGLLSDIVPESYVAESVIEAFKNEDIVDKKILLPRAEKARPVLPVELTKMGAGVDEIVAYRTVHDPVGEKDLLNFLENESIDLVTFTSSSTVTNFKTIIKENNTGSFSEKTAIACIGPITAETAVKSGFRVDIEAKEFTISGLCNAILDFYS